VGAESVGHMNNSPVLDVGAGADVDGVNVAAKGGTKPHAAFLAQSHGTNNCSLGATNAVVAMVGFAPKKWLMRSGKVMFSRLKQRFGQHNASAHQKSTGEQQQGTRQPQGKTIR
jgi:hypothetical protein